MWCKTLGCIVTLILGILVALSVPTVAQQPQKIPRIGYIAARAADREQILLPAFVQGLRELGYTEGHNIVIELRQAASGQLDRLRDLAAELVRLKVDVIVVSTSSEGELVAKAVITTVPFVFIASPDPVRLGLVESLARPGGNATGLSDFHGPLGAKRLELLKEVASLQRRASPSCGGR